MKKQMILSHKIVIDFKNFLTIFTFALTDYWHDRRAYVNGSFRSGSFRTWSFLPNVLSISFGGSFPPIISSHELSCSQGELIVYPCSGFRPSTIFSSPEPKAHGQLIVYQSSRPCVRPCVCSHFQT